MLLDATAQSLFIVLKDHKLAKVITLTPGSYENVAATEGIDFLCVNLHNLSLQNYRLREGTGIWVTTCMQYLLVFETD